MKKSTPSKKTGSQVSEHLTKNKISFLHQGKGIKGFLFIGDPHIWSFKPGRRRDEDYLKTILGKLEWAANYAKDHQLWPVILGDLLHESTDNNLMMISRLMHTLQLFHKKPVVLVGNHDLTEKQLTPGTVLHLLYHAEQIHALTHNGLHSAFEMEHESGPKTVLLGGTPYGFEIPKSLISYVPDHAIGHDDIKQSLGADEIVWITHDDLAFDSHYPGATALHPIVGVDRAINGHMHHTQKPQKKGDTYWYNPGNINRLTIDLIDHIPKVWVYRPAETQSMPSAEGVLVPLLDGIIIPHIKGSDILSMEGYLAQHTHLQAPEKHTQPTAQTSRFIELSQSDTLREKTDDGVFLKQIIEEEYQTLNPPDHIKNIVSHLFDQALQLHRHNKDNQS